RVTRTSNRLLPRSAMASTRPTISERTKSSSIAATGISTLCSTAMARARSSIERASQRTRETACNRGCTAALTDERLLPDHEARSAKPRLAFTAPRGNSPARADWRAAEHLDDVRACRCGGVIRQRIGGKEAMRDDLVVGDGGRRLAKCAHHEERDVIAAGSAIVEENSVQPRRRRHLDVALLAQLPRQRLGERLAGLDPAARQVP